MSTKDRKVAAMAAATTEAEAATTEAEAATTEAEAATTEAEAATTEAEAATTEAATTEAATPEPAPDPVALATAAVTLALADGAEDHVAAALAALAALPSRGGKREALLAAAFSRRMVELAATMATDPGAASAAAVAALANGRLVTALAERAAAPHSVDPVPVALAAARRSLAADLTSLIRAEEAHAAAAPLTLTQRESIAETLAADLAALATSELVESYIAEHGGRGRARKGDGREARRAARSEPADDTASDAERDAVTGSGRGVWHGGKFDGATCERITPATPETGSTWRITHKGKAFEGTGRAGREGLNAAAVAMVGSAVNAWRHVRPMAAAAAVTE